jgi:hypothetical protein
VIRLLTLPLVLSALVACHDGVVACTDLAAASVGVTVLDQDGGKIEGATVTFDAGNGPQDCESFEAGEYICGFEVQGDITIHVSAVGFEDAEQVVHVDEDDDGCHVVEQFVTFDMAPADCTEQIVPAMHVTVAGEGDEVLSNVDVSWGYPNADMDPIPCDLREDGSWDCAPEESGDLEVYAGADGHQTDIRQIQVDLDAAGCHPVTEEVAFELQWLPD